MKSFIVKLWDKIFFQTKKTKYEIVEWESGFFSLHNNDNDSYYDIEDRGNESANPWWGGNKFVITHCITDDLTLLKEIKQKLIDKDAFLEQSTIIKRIIKD